MPSSLSVPSWAMALCLLAACVVRTTAFGLPGSKSAPVHLGGGFKIENMDAFAMTVGALVLSVIRSGFQAALHLFLGRGPAG
jgi:hypothetical protein